MRAIVTIAFLVCAYLVVTVVTAAVMAKLMAMELGDEEPDGELFAMAAFAGLLWPLVIPVGVIALWTRAVYRRVARFMENENP